MMKSLLVLGILFSQYSLAEKQTFTLISPSFDDGALLPIKQVAKQGDCKGRNDSPALDWTDGPQGTQSYAITAYDPDAPSDSGWWHWILFNIPKSVTSIREAMKTFPKGSIQGRNDWGNSRFDGACPPPGSKPHHYVFTVYALKVDKLPLTSDASGAMVGYYIHQNMLDKASITATYSR